MVDSIFEKMFITTKQHSLSFVICSLVFWRPHDLRSQKEQGEQQLSLCEEADQNDGADELFPSPVNKMIHFASASCLNARKPM